MCMSADLETEKPRQAPVGRDSRYSTPYMPLSVNENTVNFCDVFHKSTSARMPWLMPVEERLKNL